MSPARPNCTCTRGPARADGYELAGAPIQTSTSTAAARSSSHMHCCRFAQMSLLLSFGYILRVATQCVKLNLHWFDCISGKLPIVLALSLTLV